MVGARLSRGGLVGVAAVGVGLLLILAGDSLATWPTAALPPDLPQAERDRLCQVTERVSVTARRRPSMAGSSVYAKRPFSLSHALSRSS